MGVDNLKKLCKGEYKTSPITDSIIHQSNLAEYEGKKVAIDFSSYIYKYKVATGDKWLNSVSMFITVLKRAGIHGLFCFDGKPPPEKKEEGDRRKEASQNLEDKIFNISFDLDTYKSSGVISQLLLDTMEKIIKKDSKAEKVGRLLHTKGPTGVSKKKNEGINVEAIEEFIKKKESQVVTITKEDIDDIKEMITLYGGKYIQAPSEAESLAAYLWSVGEVSAVITEDTDILAYGVETFISGVNVSTGECEVILLSELLELLELDQRSFLDFCIMCGCDYGGTIKGIGIATALKNIQKYKSIDKWGKEENKDISIYRHLSSRRIFKSYGGIIEVPTDDEKEEIKIELLEEKESEKEIQSSDKPSPIYKADYWDTDIDFEKLFQFLSIKKCFYSSKNIESIWNGPEICFED